MKHAQMDVRGQNGHHPEQWNNEVGQNWVIVHMDYRFDRFDPFDPFQRDPGS